MEPMNRRFWRRQKDTVKSKKEVFPDARNTDVIIPVMGKTGVGKSTFINKLLGVYTMEVGHDLTSCTAYLRWEVIDPELIAEICPGWGNRRVIIVDTPGFDDTYQDDAEILRRIAAWLASSYADDMKLGGIIYLQNIAEHRLEGASRRNLEVFKKLCGNDALSRVILGTTSWQEVRPGFGEAREKELKDKFWREMIRNKSTVMRFSLSQSSALDMLRHILERHMRPLNDTAALRIQEELVVLERYVPQTDAGKELRHSIEEILEMQKKMQPGDDGEKEELRQKLRTLEKQMKAMRLPFFMRLKSLFGL